MPNKVKLSEFTDSPILGQTLLKFIGETGSTISTRLGWRLSGNPSVTFLSTSFVNTNYGPGLAVLTNNNRDIGFNIPSNSDLVIYNVNIGLSYPPAMAASNITIQSHKYYSSEGYPVNEFVSNFPNTPCSVFF
ncbi:MAG: hypothetical protein HC836_39340 [Richelia sp. RM2_1_2]|nr:hypothetical protein [Richelia sp. RM2_1_2]